MPGDRAGRALRITTRNARFQQWEALLRNRSKRQRLGEFLVQGVRPIDQAIAHGWPIRALLVGEVHSQWARGLMASGVAEETAHLAPELLLELSEKDDAPPELIAVVGMPSDGLHRIARPASDGLVVVLDRPISPGNLGSLIRSADALGVHGVIVTGRSADVYDPKTVRASRGSLFAVPAVRVDSPSAVVEWLRQAGPVTIVGTSEDAPAQVWQHDFRTATALVVGNETAGMSAFWAEHCDVTVRIPMAGSASSLNAAIAASITLYEITRQRASHIS